MLGIREPVYGTGSYQDLCALVEKNSLGIKSMKVTVKQSNSEGELVTWIQQAYGK